MTRHRHIIIAGSNKCGTTSLFRYFAHHPDIKISAVKESQFFRNSECDLTDVGYRSYLSIFPDEDLGGKVLLEATPQYLHSGKAVAQRIRALLPDTRLIFMLRDPSSRFRSAFLSQRGKVSWAARNLSFDEFVELAIAAETSGPGELSRIQSACLHELRVGCFADNLADYFSVFDAHQISIRFFDHFKSNVRGFVEDLCRESGLTASAYADFEFTIENQTRQHRSDRLRAIADRLNVRFESVLNRHPTLRQTARRIYDLANTQKANKDIDSSAMSRVDDYYGRRNLELSRLLARQKPGLELPSWLPAGADLSDEEL